jgi:hypothetical protein
MALEHLKAELSLLVDKLAEHPADAHELYLMLHQRLNELRALSLPVPDDLARLEQSLEAEFAQNTTGRGAQTN